MGMIYEMEELLPVLAWLTDKYTGKESTSVAYHKANQLLGAVIYCIGTFQSGMEGDTKPMATQRIPAKEAYDRGYEMVVREVIDTKERYNEMITDFCDYGNIAYRDTIVKGMPLFFCCYDARFAPQDNILMLDYPVPGENRQLKGIHRIRQYLGLIEEEQAFLRQFSEGRIKKLLYQYSREYDELFFNLREVVSEALLL